MQNSNLKFGAMPISYTSSNFSQKQHGNGLHESWWRSVQNLAQKVSGVIK